MMRVAVAPGSADDAAAAQLVEALGSLGHQVTLLGDLEVDAQVARVPVAELDIHVSPGFLTSSYAIVQTLRATRFDAVVFSGRGCIGFCTTRLRALGLEFTDVRLLTHVSEPSLQRIERSHRPFLSKGEVGVAIAERLTIEHSDGVVSPESAVGEWLSRQSWSLPPLHVAGAGVSLAEAIMAALDGPLRVEHGESRDGSSGEPSVSVVIPHYEQPLALGQCLDGFAAQDQLPDEIVVVDDGSPSPATASELRVLEGMSWPWQLRIIHRRRGGAHAARNAGFRATQSDLLLFFDHDDVPYSTLVSTLVRARRSSCADVVVAGARTFRGDGLPSHTSGDTVAIKLGRPYELGLLSNQYGGPVGLWPRDLLDRVGGFRDARVLNGDWEILARATARGASVLSVPEPLYSYRVALGGLANTDVQAKRNATLSAVAHEMGSNLPRDARMLPLLVAGAYEQLEREAQRRRAHTLGGRVAALRRRVGRGRYRALRVVRRVARRSRTAPPS